MIHYHTYIHHMTLMCVFKVYSLVALVLVHLLVSP
jgi:hypothetical protein